MFHLLLILWAEHVASLQYSENLHLFLNSPFPSLRKSCTQEGSLKKETCFARIFPWVFCSRPTRISAMPRFFADFFPRGTFTCRFLHRNGCHMEVTTSNHAWWSSQLRCKCQVVREEGSNCLLIMGCGFLKPVVEPLLCQRTGYYPISVWVTTKYNKDIQKVQMSVKLNKRQKMAMFKLPVDSLTIPNGRSSNAWIGYIHIYVYTVYIYIYIYKPFPCTTKRGVVASFQLKISVFTGPQPDKSPNGASLFFFLGAGFVSSATFAFASVSGDQEQSAAQSTNM